MSERTDNFIKTVGMLAKNEYLARNKWILPSVCIAQAALESGWNLEAKTLFGIKGSGFTATTSEYYNGHYVQIQDSFRCYPNAASAVVGYYDFLRDTPRYANALNNTDYKNAVDKLIHTIDGAPYATDPNYISKIVSIIDQYGLAQYDVRDDVPEQDTPEPDPEDTGYHVGDCVNFNAIYESSTSTNALKPLYTSGEITKVIAGAPNPYLINNGTGWVNNGCITTDAGTPQEPSTEICAGDSVRVLNAEQYNGNSFAVYFPEYEVIEVKGDRVVIGINGEVTAAVNICNLEKA